MPQNLRPEMRVRGLGFQVDLQLAEQIQQGSDWLTLLGKLASSIAQAAKEETLSNNLWTQAGPFPVRLA